MAGYGAKEARINRETRVRVNLCGDCGCEINQNELLCTDCLRDEDTRMNPTYHEVNPGRRNTHIAVYLEGRRVGTIKEKRAGGWYYVPKGSRVNGEVFPTLAACKHSLEAV